MRDTQVSIVSTYFENVGDELIREGVKHQLVSCIGASLNFFEISKSNPLSIYAPRLMRLSHAPLHRMRKFGRRLGQAAYLALMAMPFGAKADRIRRSQILVFAGTPLFYMVRGHSFLDSPRWSWPEAVFARRLQGQPMPRVLALGVGSILDRAPDEVLRSGEFAREVEFIRRFLERCELVTARDELTYELLRKIRPSSADRIVSSRCPSVWAHQRLAISRRLHLEPRKRIPVAFSTESAQWDERGEEVVRHRYRSLELVVKALQDLGLSPLFVAHNELDHRVQAQLAADYGAELQDARSARELLELVADASFVITWRVHGALAALSLGVPAILFKTDSRFAMAEALGAVILDDRDATDDEQEIAVRKAIRACLSSGPSIQANVDRILEREMEVVRALLR